MKKLFMFLFSLTLLLSFMPLTAQENKKSIVIYYSLTETTAHLAQEIAQKTNSDIFRLECMNPYSKNMSECGKQAKEDRSNNFSRPLKKIPDLTQYGTIFIGTPVWSNDAALPVLTYLNAQDFSGKTVIPFCTYWSTGEKETLESIALKTENANHKEGLSQSHGQKSDVDFWLKKIGFNK